MLVRIYVACGPPVAGVDCREPAVCRLAARVTRARAEQGPGHSFILGFGPSNGEMTRGGVEAVTHHAPHLTSHRFQRLQREGHSCFISDIISSVLISIQLWHVCMKFVTKLNIYLNYLNLTFNSFEFFAIVFHSIEIGILKVYFFH